MLSYVLVHTSALIVNGSLGYNTLNKRLQLTNEIYEPKFGNVLLPIQLGVTDDCQHFDRNLIMVSRFEFLLFNFYISFLLEQLHNSEKQQDQQLILPAVDKLKDSCLPFETGMLRHQLNFGSVYDDNVNVSTFQDQWIIVDYIFYRKELTMTNQFFEKNLKLLARFELPTLQYCFFKLPFGGIPNGSQGSDHFSLAAKFLLSPTSNSSA